MSSSACLRSQLSQVIHRKRDAAGSGCKLIDGFAVAAGIGDKDAERLLAALSRNDCLIRQLAAERDGTDFLIFEGDHSKRDEIVRLMAQNYRLSRRLQGRDVLGDRPKPGSSGASAAALISSGLNRTNQESGKDRRRAKGY